MSKCNGASVKTHEADEGLWSFASFLKLLVARELLHGADGAFDLGNAGHEDEDGPGLAVATRRAGSGAEGGTREGEIHKCTTSPPGQQWCNYTNTAELLGWVRAGSN